MKECIVKGLLIGLTLVLIPATSVSAQTVTAGSSCKILNQKVVFKNKVYTCIKPGKKLFWDRGVTVVKPTTAVPSTPSPKPTTPSTPTLETTLGPKDGDAPLPLQGCGAGNYFYQIIDGVMQRSFYSDKGFTSLDSRAEINFDPVRVRAFHSIRDHRAVTKIFPPIDFHISSDFPTNQLAYLKVQLEDSIAYWADFLPVGTRVQATFLTEKQISFVDPNVISRPEDVQWVMDNFNNTTLDSYNNPTNLGYINCGWRYGISGSHIITHGPNIGQIGFWIITPTANKGKYWDPVYLPHEFTHGIQDIFWFNHDINPIENGAPYFLVEGAGQLFGIALSMPNVGWFQDDLYRRINENYISGVPLTHNIPSTTLDILNMIKSAEKNDGASGTLWAYTVGSQLWEWVIANYGFDSYWNIVNGISRTQNYDATIFKVIGKSKEDLYAEAAPYILKNFKNALAKKNG